MQFEAILVTGGQLCLQFCLTFYFSLSVAFLQETEQPYGSKERVAGGWFSAQYDSAGL